MFSAKTAIRHGPKLGASWPNWHRRGMVTEADVEQARKYCENQLRLGDYESYLIRRFVPKYTRDAYDALRTLNLELARLPEMVSNPTTGRFRMQFWRDTVNSTFAGSPQREPISILLSRAVSDLATRSPGGSASSLKFWLLRLIDTREQYMDSRPYTSLAALEEYAENTYASLMYMTLACVPLRSVHVDHLASHIGKACGIVATLRGIPVLAAPSPPVLSLGWVDVADGRKPALPLPLDVMADVGLKEEDVYRKGPNAPGLQDAVFKVATRANDHLITAREMLKDLRAGNEPSHHYEHGDEAEHLHGLPPVPAGDGAAAELHRAFGVLLEAVPAQIYLSRLEIANFDPFAVRTNWKLPWAIWKSLSRHQI